MQTNQNELGEPENLKDMVVVREEARQQIDTRQLEDEQSDNPTGGTTTRKQHFKARKA